ncbi:Transcription factor bHLH168 [Camellia lanceoleosa]|uniref:Transcription factor bHLH168 n=1 Tax=Camellia lanceoleosa TaxID=1840588 RepID=A0ACC0IH20_9ERIC|nr:Transcription factor bHLH168 [Camellia lanceoleosa]
MLDQATNYIVLLRKNVEELKQRKELMIKGSDENSRTTTKDDGRNSSVLPVFTFRDMVSILEVNLITGLNTNNNNFMLGIVFSVLKEEGAEVVKASYSTVGDKIFCTIHSKPFYSRIGIETSRLHERMKVN